MQGQSRNDRELLDAGEIAGHLIPAGSVFAFLSARSPLFPAEDLQEEQEDVQYVEEDRRR